MKKLVFRAALAAAAVCSGFSGANAGQATGTLSVSATVLTQCEVSQTNAVVFPSVLSSNSSYVNAAPGSVVITCDSGHGYTVDLGNGGHFSSPWRQMVGTGNSSHLLEYQLYSDSLYSNIWGSGITGGGTVSGTGTGSAQTITVYGRIPSTATFTTDGYTDSVTVTLNY